MNNPKKKKKSKQLIDTAASRSRDSQDSENLGPNYLDTKSKGSQNDSEDVKYSKDKIKLKDAVRRKSCCCKCCGGMSNFEGKVMHIIIPNPREVAIKKQHEKQQKFIQSTIVAIMKLKSKFNN